MPSSSARLDDGFRRLWSFASSARGLVRTVVPTVCARQDVALSRARIEVSSCRLTNSLTIYFTVLVAEIMARRMAAQPHRAEMARCRLIEFTRKLKVS
jgi:hypothetical protein